MRSSFYTLVAYTALFVALYAGFGVQSPYLPALLRDHGLDPAFIGAVLAAGTGIRLIAGPATARFADALDRRRLVFGLSAAAAGSVGLAYGLAHGFWALLAVTLLQAAALAPLAQIADALVLRTAAATGGTFGYGRVRGAGSGAFIFGSVLAGQIIVRQGLGTIIWLNATLLLIAATYVRWVPRLSPAKRSPAAAGRYRRRSGLWQLPTFRRVLLVAALILGSHAMHDGFAVIRWRAAGIGADTAGLLWGEAVAAEVIVFYGIGAPLLQRFGPAGAAMLAAVAAAVRWAVSAETAALPALAVIQPLHGVTFALLHLACMRRLAEIVPAHLSATAMALYGILATGAATALLTLLSGWLYGRVGANGFWVMAVIALAALPFARKL